MLEAGLFFLVLLAIALFFQSQQKESKKEMVIIRKKRIEDEAETYRATAKRYEEQKEEARKAPRTEVTCRIEMVDGSRFTVTEVFSAYVKGFRDNLDWMYLPGYYDHFEIIPSDVLADSFLLETGGYIRTDCGRLINGKYIKSYKIIKRKVTEDD